MPLTRTLVRNGVSRVVTADDSTTLLEVVRRELGVRSAVHGCGTGQCGACRVLVDGAAKNSCAMTLADVAEGATIEAYEELSADPAAEAAVAAFTAERPTRCTMCVPAIGVTAVALARRGDETSGAIEESLATAACICTGRGSMRRALVRGALSRRRE